MADLLGDNVEATDPGVPDATDVADATAQPVREDQPYVGLALRWRPRTFDELVGQQSLGDTLKNAITNFPPFIGIARKR